VWITGGRLLADPPLFGCGGLLRRGRWTRVNSPERRDHGSGSLACSHERCHIRVGVGGYGCSAVHSGAGSKATGSTTCRVFA